MKRYLGLIGLIALTPLCASAQLATSASGSTLEMLLNNILTFSSNVLIPFIIGIGFLVFVYGMFQYFIAGGANPDAQDKGKSLMIYATAGFVLIIIFWGIVNLLTSTTGLQGKSVSNLPSVPSTK